MKSRFGKTGFSLWFLLVALAWQGVAAANELSLDGVWEIVFDHENAGLIEDWYQDKKFQSLDTRKIEVPSAWERIEKDYEGVAFYRREFDVPAEWKGKVVQMHFGAVNYIAEVWVNGESIGTHEGGFTPFALRVDRILKPGESNVVVIRVQGPIILSDKVVDGIGPLETPQWRGGIMGGIWQSVKLVATGDVVLDDVYMVPDRKSGVIRLTMQLDNTGTKAGEVDLAIDVVEVSNPDRPVATLREQMQLKPGRNRQAQTLQVNNPRDWSPEDPFLYTIRVRLLHKGEESDAWQHRFGFREFTIRDKDWYLNGEKVFLKATFFEGLYPNGIACPDSGEMVRREIQLAKDAGFNMIRPWRRPPAPMWLDIADEMGVLVVGSPVLECMALPLSTPYLPQRVENEIRESVLRDRNRTCVVQWELFNELHRPILNQMMRPMAMLTRDLDPTRLILDESGGWAFGANMYLPYEYEPTKFNDIHNYSGPLINNHIYDAYLTIGMTDEEKAAFGFKGQTPGRNVVPGLMSFVSELGYGSVPNLPDVNQRFAREGNPLTPAYRYHGMIEADQKRVLREAGFDHLYPDFETFCLEQQSIHGEANKRMIEAVRANPDVAGYCIHALAAGDWIFGAGLIDIWRNPKGQAYELTKAANQPRITSIRMFPRNVYASRGARLTVTGINELDELNARVHVSVVSESGAVVFEETNKRTWNPGVTSLFVSNLKTAGLSGTCEVRVKVIGSDDSVITGNTYGFDVFPESRLTPPAGRVALLDIRDQLRPFLKQSGINFVEYSENTPIGTPVLVASLEPQNDRQKEKLGSLKDFIYRGGTAVYLDPRKYQSNWRSKPQIKSEYLPVTGNLTMAKGLWTCIPHLVRDHPVFDGLPVNGPMREVYENVWPWMSIMNIGGESLAASIGFDWFSGDHKMHYSGPGESWWGSDLSIVPYGSGSCMVSQFRLLENLGSDPVADLLLFNMIKFVTK